MGLTAPTDAVRAAAEDVCRAVAGADVVLPVGARTQWEVGGEPEPGREVHVPGGIVRHDPADLVVTVLAGTSVAELTAVLGEAGQECPLDPRDPAATVGGVLACGLSGHRRLRYGPVRDRVLEVGFVTGDARIVKGGGPTVKNVSGYDVPRLLVGSLGTLGIVTHVTLRCLPRPSRATWGTTEADPGHVRRRLVRPSCVAWDGRRTWCLVEGHAGDVDAELAAGGLAGAEGPPPAPEGRWRGRMSVPPGSVPAAGRALDGFDGVEWLAEMGVGTVHVGAASVEAFAAARRVAHEAGGWMLREAGAGIDAFGCPVPNGAVMRRLKEALDPQGKLNPGRMSW